MTIPTLTEKELEPLARAICALEDVVGEVERDRAQLWDADSSVAELDVKLNGARRALIDVIGELIGSVACTALARQARRFSAANVNGATAP